MLKFNVLEYFTTWSIIISYTVLFLTMFTKVPLWLFLTACCSVTCCSFIGTFFNTIPTLSKSLSKEEIDYKDVTIDIVIDIFSHILPFVIIIYFFNYFALNVSDSGHKFIYSILLFMFLLLIYISVINPDEIYEKDTTNLSIFIIILYTLCYILFYKTFCLRDSLGTKKI